MMHINKRVFFINKKKKIVYVVEALGGGVLTYLELLCNNLPKNFEITILYGVRKQTPKKLKELFNKNNIELIKINNFKRSINPISDFKSYKEVKNHIDNIAPDVVHLHSSKAGAIGRIIKALHYKNYKNIKFLYTPHGYAFLMSDTSKIKRFIYYSVEKILGSLNTVTVACGSGEYAYAKKISKKSLLVNNAIDIEYIQSFMNDNSNSKEVVYTVGRISYQKNPDLFNKIALSNPKIQFVWVGDGPDSHKLFADNIEITGWVPHDEVLNRVQSYKYFILTSRWEGLPVSLLESMASGKCCFVTDVSGNREVINETNGFNFSNSKEFTEEFLSLTSKTKSRLSSNAINDVFSKYSLKTFIGGYSKIYGK